MNMHISHDDKAVRRILARWADDPGRRTNDPAYREGWYQEQCGSCAFWFPLAGRLGNDYGACANGESPFDGRVRFEHDGCEAHEDAGDWVLAEDVE